MSAIFKAIIGLIIAEMIAQTEKCIWIRKSIIVLMRTEGEDKRLSEHVEFVLDILEPIDHIFYLILLIYGSRMLSGRSTPRAVRACATEFSKNIPSFIPRLSYRTPLSSRPSTSPEPDMA